MEEIKIRTYEEIAKYLNEKEADYNEIDQPLYKAQGNLPFAVYDITIIGGDWKHSHGYLDYLMKEIGYYKTREDEIHDEYTDDGDDCYSSVHRYVYRSYYELFNGKIAE